MTKATAMHVTERGPLMRQYAMESTIKGGHQIPE